MKLTMKKTEDLIWDRITNNAKNKFDYVSFKNNFKETNKHVAENILFKIIFGFASHKTKKTISLELFNEILLLGYNWKLEDIQIFVDDKDHLFELEIYATQLVNAMLQEGKDPRSVLTSINQILT
jgi:hypothetical protein